ncbi:MAG: hypothetical protein AAB922_05740 [Patescibacteria group bacterium]
MANTPIYRKSTGELVTNFGSATALTDAGLINAGYSPDFFTTVAPPPKESIVQLSATPKIGGVTQPTIETFSRVGPTGTTPISNPYISPPSTPVPLLGATAFTPSPTPTTISASSLTPRTTQNFSFPNVSGSAVDAYNAAQSAALSFARTTPDDKTPKEEEQSDLIKQIMELNTTEAQRPAEQAQKERAQGVQEKQATVNSLMAQQRQITNEAAQIQLRVQEGRGVTTLIDQRQRTEALRVNAIQSLSISSLLAAAQGDLANAQNLADRALDAKYAPIEAQLEASNKNLILIKNDPETTRQQEEKKANERLAINAQIKAQVDEAKRNMQEIQKIGIEAASKGADALTLQKIQNSSNPIDAARLAAPFTNPPKATAAKTAATVSDKPMSTNQIEQFRRSYGWTPPFGYSEPQLLQYMKDNPNATKEELSAGAGAVAGATSTAISKEGVEKDMRSLFVKSELHTMAKELGFASMWTNADTDIDRMFENATPEQLVRKLSEKVK